MTALKYTSDLFRSVFFLITSSLFCSYTFSATEETDAPPQPQMTTEPSISPSSSSEIPTNSFVNITTPTNRMVMPDIDLTLLPEQAPLATRSFPDPSSEGSGFDDTFSSDISPTLMPELTPLDISSFPGSPSQTSGFDDTFSSDIPATLMPEQTPLATSSFPGSSSQIPGFDYTAGINPTPITPSFFTVVPTESPTENTYQSTVVEPGSPEDIYAQIFCHGESFDEIYRLNDNVNDSADYSLAALERLPIGEGLEYRAYGRTDPLPSPTESINDDEFVANILIMLDDRFSYTARVLPHFTFNRKVRIGYCGFNKDQMDSLQTYGSGVGASGLPKPKRVTIKLDVLRGFTYPVNGGNTLLHLINTELVLINIHLDGNYWSDNFPPLILGEGKFIGYNVKLSKNNQKAENNQKVYFSTLIVSDSTTLEFHDSEFDYNQDYRSLMVINRGSIKVKDSSFLIRGQGARGIDISSGQVSAEFDGVTFRSQGEPDTSRVAYHGIFTIRSRDTPVLNSQTVIAKNNVFLGSWDPAFAFENAIISDDSINNDFSDATGTRCLAVNHGAGMMLFTDGISCPSTTLTESPSVTTDAPSPEPTQTTSEIPVTKLTTKSEPAPTESPDVSGGRKQTGGTSQTELNPALLVSLFLGILVAGM